MCAVQSHVVISKIFHIESIPPRPRLPFEPFMAVTPSVARLSNCGRAVPAKKISRQEIASPRHLFSSDVRDTNPEGPGHGET